MNLPFFPLWADWTTCISLNESQHIDLLYWRYRDILITTNMNLKKILIYIVMAYGVLWLIAWLIAWFIHDNALEPDLAA